MSEVDLVDASEAPWQRLDRRMLLVEPARAVKDFLPLIIGVFVLGMGDSGDVWQLVVVVVPIVWGVLRYWSTRFRISDGRLELRRGLVNRTRRSTPLGRIRTVDLTSTPLHRIFGLTSMRIGTGTTSIGDDDLKLDGLSKEAAAALRTELLRRAEADPVAVTDDLAGQVAPEPAVEVVARLDPRWARFGPLTTVGLVGPFVLVGGAAHLVGQFDPGSVLPDHLAVRLAVWLVALVAVLAVIALFLVVPVVTYLTTNWGYTLSREPDAWAVRRGLFTTRHTHLDRDRVAGLDIGEPLAARLASGARLDAIATGVSLLGDEGKLLVPTAPRALVETVAGRVLGTPEPVVAPLVEHGPAASRRRWIRALVPAVAVAGGVVVAVTLDLLPGWTVAPALLLVPAAAVLAHDRARSLGHALVAGHLVVRSGSLARSREILQARRVIGWQFTSTPFQRRAGLVTMTATTAGGDQAVTAPDIPAHLAVDLADAAIPGLVSQFLR